nr:MAG TPA: hypothetical protein [Caudoviricetes sp.]
MALKFVNNCESFTYLSLLCLPIPPQDHFQRTSAGDRIALSIFSL